MKLRLLIILLCSLFCLILAAAAQAQPDEKDVQEQIETRVYTTTRVGGTPPVIDGAIDDAIWSTVEWSGDFVQRDPTDGDPPSKLTEFKVLYDDESIFFAFRLHDDPELVSKRLARRDGFPGDWIEINIDSYFDHRTAFSFTLSLSGTRGDELISNDGQNWDSTWNPIWNGATKITSGGWTAEFRIPLSQLRFSSASEQTWGLQVQRRIFRLEERSSWQRIPKDRSGWVSQFGELQGMRDLKPKRHIELLPYAVASTERFEEEPGNPFRTGEDSMIDAGLDGKIGVTNNLTLDFTINPDFGQVEADPSQVNLSAFETFFREQRPFFLEGNEILDLRVAPAITGGSFARDNLFYSRRIGAGPHLYPDGTYVDTPDHTTILGAFKLSGKTAKGLSIGVMDSVTMKESATIDDGLGNRSHATVEPFTNYFAGRLQQDFKEGDTQFGGMITAVNRDLENAELTSALVSDAYAGGFDFSTYFKDRDYRLEASWLGSTLSGHPDAISDVQTSSARYYQRPGNDSATFDPTRTSLSGHGGSVRFQRTSNHSLMFQTGVAWRSPGFEINDLGFMRNSDQINQFTWVGYTKRDPFLIFDRWQLNANQWLDWDYAGNFLGARYNMNTNAQFKNKYSAGINMNRTDEYTSNDALRGGPASMWPGDWSGSFWANTDHRKDLTFDLGAYFNVGDEDSSDYHEVWGGVTYRPSDSIRISLNPSFSENYMELQYVQTDCAVSGSEECSLEDTRYLYGSLDQQTISLTFRIDYSITPNLTVQYYGSPFVSLGRYNEFKRITDPVADNYHDRFSVFTEDQIAYNAGTDSYDIDENMAGGTDYSIGNPDFDFRQFNSNLVVRWEYSPGSTLFVVWSQSRLNTVQFDESISLGNDLDRLFDSDPHDVVLVKISKWFAP